jgi:transcription initiation factor IIE alpha subunit
MKIEDAKALLIDCTDLICRECNDRHRGCEKQKSYPDFASTVLVALEKQIPKEPIRRERTLEGGAITYWHICPSCKNRGLLDRWHRQLKHCPHCGQALRWSD